MNTLFRTATFSALLLALGLSACSRGNIDTAEVIRPVRVIELKAANPIAEETYPGQIEPRYETSLGFQVGGKIIRRSVDLGDLVHKGQEIARLDPKDLALALSAAQARFNAAQLDLKQSNIDLQRAQTLFAKHFVSQAQVDQRKLAADAAQSRFEQAKAELSVQKNQSGYGVLRAPADGVITHVFGEVGQVVAPAQPVANWADLKQVQVRIAVPESRLDQYKVGRQASVTLWSGGEPLLAKIREVSPVADPITRAYPVYLDLIEGANRAKFGMSAKVRFEHQVKNAAFELPGTALVASAKGSYVWLLDEKKGEVHQHFVTPYDVSGTSFLVKEGLKVGDLVVVAGTHVLSEGQKAKRFLEPDDLQSKE